MRRCEACGVAIEGGWRRCPLCGETIADGGSPAPPSPLATVPLVFSRRRVLRVLFLTSLGVILASLSAQLLFARGADGTGGAGGAAGLDGIGVWRSVWLGVSAMWLVVIMAVRKRRNVAKGTLYLVIIVGLICVYWDYLTGWHGWALTYAVPIVCAASTVALLIAGGVMRIDVGDHILYSVLTVLLGLAPIVFALLGWVTNSVASAICGGLSLIALVLLQLAGGREMRHELAKRLHL